MRRTAWLQRTLWTVAALGIFAIIGIRIWPDGDSSGKTTTRSRAPQPVETLLIQTEVFYDETVTTGTIRALEQIDLRAEVAGKLLEIGFEEGETVRKGEVLLRVNDAELEAELMRAEKRRDLASMREIRLGPLVESGGISETEYDEAKSEVAILNAEMEVIRQNIARHTVQAPFDGVVGLRYISRGAYVTPSTRIASFQQTDKVRLEFNLPEKYASAVKVGQDIRFTVVSEEMPFNGKIYAIEPQIDPGTRTLQLRALAENKAGRLRPGAYARVIWLKEEVKDAIFIPAVAIMSDNEESSVYVVESGTVVKREVEVGLRVRGRIRVLSGLESGEVIVVKGIQQVRPGQKVSIIGEG